MTGCLRIWSVRVHALKEVTIFSRNEELHSFLSIGRSANPARVAADRRSADARVLYKTKCEARLKQAKASPDTQFLPA
jgi:hypothetical protein